VNWLTQDLALAERLVHPPLGVVEDAQGAHLAGEAIGLLGRVAALHPEQHQQAGADLGDPLALDVDRSLADPLHQRPHRHHATSELHQIPYLAEGEFDAVRQMEGRK